MTSLLSKRRSVNASARTRFFDHLIGDHDLVARGSIIERPACHAVSGVLIFTSLRKVYNWGYVPSAQPVHLISVVLRDPRSSFVVKFFLRSITLPFERLPFSNGALAPMSRTEIGVKTLPERERITTRPSPDIAIRKAQCQLASRVPGTSVRHIGRGQHLLAGARYRQRQSDFGLTGNALHGQAPYPIFAGIACDE